MGWPVEVWYAESKKRNLLLLEHSAVHVDFCVFMCVWVLCIGMYMCRCVYEWVYMDVCPFKLIQHLLSTSFATKTLICIRISQRNSEIK